MLFQLRLYRLPPTSATESAKWPRNFVGEVQREGVPFDAEKIGVRLVSLRYFLAGRFQRNTCFVGGVQRGSAPLAAKRRNDFTLNISAARCGEESKETPVSLAGESKGDGVPVAHDLACKV